MLINNMADCNKSVYSLRLAMTSPVQSFLTAFRFLTVIPVTWKQNEDGVFFQASVIWFPLIGLIIGVVTAVCVSLVYSFLSSSVTAVFALLVLGGITGFLHLDGVADSGDGLLSSRPREQALEIMRDSRSGAMGVIFLLFVILGKYAALSSLSVETLLPVLILMPLGGRTAIVFSMAILPYARRENGLGRLFYSTERYYVAGIALVFFILFSCYVSLSLTLFVFPALLFTVFLFSRWCFVKLGGATGDTLGAVCEFSEFSIAVAAVIFQGSV